MAVELESAEMVLKTTQECIRRGVLTDWFLFAQHCLRIAPPLTIKEKEIRKACSIIIEALDAV
jgi:4-aminobutyrate aminotransferase-like enzyme